MPAQKHVLLRLKPDVLDRLDTKIQSTKDQDGKPMHRSVYLRKLIERDLLNEKNTSTDGFDDLFDSASNEPIGEVANDTLAEFINEHTVVDELARAESASESAYLKYVREQSQQFENRRIYDAECAEAARLGITYDELIISRYKPAAPAATKDYWEQLADDYSKPADRSTVTDNKSDTTDSDNAEGADLPY